MMRRCAGFNTDEAWHQLLEECQDITSLQLAPDDHLAYRVDAVDLKNRLRDVETDRRDPVHAALLRIVVTPSATTSMALTCQWRSGPQHQELTFRPQRFTFILCGNRSVGYPKSIVVGLLRSRIVRSLTAKGYYAVLSRPVGNQIGH